MREVKGRDLEGKYVLHGQLDYAKTVKLRVRVAGLDMPEKRGVPVVGRRKKMHQCVLVAKHKSRCETGKEGRDVLQEDMRNRDECDIVGDIWSPQKAKQEE